MFISFFSFLKNIFGIVLQLKWIKIIKEDEEEEIGSQKKGSGKLRIFCKKEEKRTFVLYCLFCFFFFTQFNISLSLSLCIFFYKKKQSKKKAKKKNFAKEEEKKTKEIKKTKYFEYRCFKSLKKLRKKKEFFFIYFFHL